MSRFYSHVNSAAKVIEAYKGEMPFAGFLKNFFAKQKKFGSKDRRSVAALCFGYFRIKNALPHCSISDTVLTGAFLFNQMPGEVARELNDDWYQAIGASLTEKLEVLQVNISSLFPLQSFLGNSVNKEAFAFSMLVQPDLFIRIRPGKHKTITEKLTVNSIPFEKVNEDCLRLENSTRLEDILDVNRQYVVQDYNSQQVFSLLHHVVPREAPIEIWDCCAASGGKSLLAFDYFKNCRLTVSDVRESILLNLQKRFKQAGVQLYQLIEMDLAHPMPARDRLPNNERFDVVICDAPCSGSGTWSRTPEQLKYFDASGIEAYSQLQKKIAGNVAETVKAGGYMLYITCSVFTRENEEVVQFLLENYPLSLVNQRLFTGYEMKADTLFAALLKHE